MRQSYSATNWQQEVCHFQNALNSPSYFYPICFKLHQNTVKTRPMWTVKGILISKILLSWQRVKPQFSFFGDFEAIRAFLGGLTWSKTLENVHTHWNPRQLGRRWGWDPGVAQRLYGAPWNTSENLMCSSHILARINMKLGTHIDLIEPNNFCTACHGLRPTGSQLFYCFP